MTGVDRISEPVMVSQLSSDTQTQITYPERDGNPMADNTLKFRWITVIQYIALRAGVGCRV